MSAQYWGMFEMLRRDTAAPVEEISPFHGAAAELYDQLNPPQWDDSEYVRLAAGCPGTILDLGCGTGRVSLKLAEAGHRVVGLDVSDEMLDVLRSKLESMPSEIRDRLTLLCANAATFDLEHRFDLVLLLNFTLGIISSVEPKEIVRNVAQHLTGTGMFAFDYLMVLDESAFPLHGDPIDREFSLGGRSQSAKLGVKYFPELSALIANVCWKDSGSEGDVRRSLMSLRMHVFKPAEVARLVDDAGLVIIGRRSEDFGEGSMRRTLVTCRRRCTVNHPLWHPYHAPSDIPWAGITLTEGSGCEVVDSKGRRYLDASGGLWSVNCGLGQTEIVDAVTNQLRRLSYGSLFLGRSNLPALELSRRLVELAMSPLECVYLTGSGSESVELSIKLARSFFTLVGRDQKKGILYLDASYHGTFFGSIGVSGSAPEQHIFAPLVPGLCAVPTPSPQTCPFGMTYEQYADRCAEVFEVMLDEASDSIAAFIAEPIMGSAGVIIPPRSYFERIQRACRNHNVLLIIDEVATGFGRTGRWFASEHYGLHPDIILLGKGINSGYLPLGAVLFSAEIAERFTEASCGIVHGSSHNGNPACCAAALATIEILQRDRLVDRSMALGTFFLNRLRAHTGRLGLGPLRGLGLMIFAGLRNEEGEAANASQVLAICQSMQRGGILVHPAPGGVMFYPPFVIRKEEIDAIVSCLVNVLKSQRLVDGGVVSRENGSWL